MNGANADAKVLPAIYADIAKSEGFSFFDQALAADPKHGYNLPDIIRTRHLTGYQAGSPSCSHGIDTTGLDVLSGTGQSLGIAGSVAGTTAAATAGGTGLAASLSASAVPIIGWIAAAFGVVAFGLGKIFGHHAQAVARERAALCGGSQIFNAGLDQIDQAYYSGKITGAEATKALHDFYVQWRAEYIAPIWQHCNAACVTDVQALALVDIRNTVDYQGKILSPRAKYATIGLTVLAVVGFAIWRLRQQ